MFSSRKHVFGLLYGLTAGLIFAVAAWGYNAFLLSRVHFAYPWLAFLVGIVPVLLITGLVGLLTISFQSALPGAIIWLVTGACLGAVGVWIPLDLVPRLLPVIEPGLKMWPLFSWLEPFSILMTSGAIVGGIAFLILGLLEVVLIDQASFSPYAGAILMPLLICAIFSGIVGGVIDNFANVRFREPAIALNELFEFALANQGKTIDPALSRRMHMNAVSTIENDLSANRRMFFSIFTETADQGKILVDFNGHWATCDTFQSQIAFCQPAKPLE